ncbi:MAG: hypothetical protein AB1724_03800 [Thermodesulfobacteriota bacterium]
MNNGKAHGAVPETDGHYAPRLEAGLFLLLVLIEAGLAFSMIQGRRMVGGHDGFQYFTLQYYFLNNAAYTGEIPQWMPFLTHGTVAAWWYIIQGGILQNILLLSAGLWKGAHFLPLFYAGIFVDEMLLLAGVWLLGRRFFSSPITIFFVALSVMGSCVWILQPWWNFHLYYAVPLILYFFHLFLDSGQWRHILLAGNLLFLQSLGNLPYFLPVTSLVIFLYFLFYVSINPDVARQVIRKISLGRTFALTVSVHVLSFVALYAAMNFGTDQVINYTFRSTDGTSSQDVFLTYGGKPVWRTWLELVLGVSPGLDYTLYIGMIGMPLILSGILLNFTRKSIHILLTAIILLLFSTGTVVSVLFYHYWPMMEYFRHLALIAPLIKVLLCFVAGSGFEAIVIRRPTRRGLASARIFAAVIALFLLVAGFALWRLSGDGELSTRIFDGMVPEKLYRFLGLADMDVMAILLKRSAVFALAASMAFGALSFITRGKALLYAAVVVAVLHGADMYGFKRSEISLKSAPLNKTAEDITGFSPMPYIQRRAVSFDQTNPRGALLHALPIDYGAFYWTAHALLFMDELGNPFKTDHMLMPLDRYLKTYGGQSLNDRGAPRGLIPFSRLEFPLNHPAALKISGATEDKIQFYSQAETAPSDELIAACISAPDYAGDRIFLSPLEKTRAADDAANGRNFPGGGLSDNRRLRLAYSINRFDSNHLEVTTTVSDSDSAWMLYSDVWHPFWRATVNGKPVPVYRANLAYKAVRLEKGENTVHFYFKSEWLALLYKIFGLNSLFWLFAVVYLAGGIVVFRSSGHVNPMVE